jgi:hypothetical protein
MEKKQTAVEWLYERLERMIPKTALYDIDKKQYYEQAKMENQKNISLVEWIRENVVEVQDGWQYLGELYTDKQIIEIYNTNNN